MKKFFLLAIPLALLATVSACKRNAPVDNSTTGPVDVMAINIKDLTPPKDFNFENDKQLYVKARILNPSGNTKYLIRIYSDVPGTGKLVSSGLTNGSFEYATEVQVPATTDFLWLEKVNPDGSSYFEKVKATTFTSSVFTSGPGNVHIFKKSGSGMTCNSSCNNTYNNFSGSQTFNASNKNYCFTGSMNNGNITINGNNTAIKICGTGTINSITVNGSGKVYILENSRVTINSLVTNSSNAKVKNWSDSLIINGSLTLGGEMENRGRMYVTGSLQTNSGSDLENYDYLDIGGSATFNDDVENYHTLNIGGAVAINSNCEFENDCYLHVAGNMTVNGDFHNDEYTKVDGSFTLNSSTDCEMDDAAMLSVQNLTLNDDIEGKGTFTSIIKVSGTTTINSNGELKGKLDLCDADGIETNNGSFSSPAQASCSGYIATSTCNPEGHGGITILDADSDGVTDLLDEYPNDPNRAYDSYYPDQNTFANIAFEDLWPATGDFDFNDMVLAFHIHKVLNADNKVVEMAMRVKVKAVGGSFDNGFGFQLDDIVPSAVDNVTGQMLTKGLITRSSNNTEANQDKAVIICFDSPEPTLHRAPGSFFNSIKTNGKGTSDTVTVTVTFGTPQDADKLAIAKINPFIFTNQRRNVEVHLGNYAPTSLVNTSLFGTAQDASNPSGGVYYKTANGMPWAILVPETFDYPVEKAAVNTAHLHFNEWAMSGGSSVVNWYLDLSQYRDEELIFE